MFYSSSGVSAGIKAVCSWNSKIWLKGCAVCFTSPKERSLWQWYRRPRLELMMENTCDFSTCLCWGIERWSVVEVVHVAEWLGLTGNELTRWRSRCHKNITDAFHTYIPPHPLFFLQKENVGRGSYCASLGLESVGWKENELRVLFSGRSRLNAKWLGRLAGVEWFGC